MLPNPSQVPASIRLSSTWPPHHCLLISSTNLDPLLPNSFSSIKTFQRQSVLNIGQGICSSPDPVQGSISKMFHTVLSLDNAIKLLFQKASDPYILQLVEAIQVVLPKLLWELQQGEFGLIRAEWGSAFNTSHVQQVITLIIGFVFITGKLY